ncbi:TPA: flavin reductase, partial [Klebsiella pneumoniae]|nr:flavin reductase [Klebsiella pneumoniae]
IVAAWSDDRVFRNGHWIFDDAPDELRTVHYVAGGQFYAIGKGSKFEHGPGQD